MKKFLLASLACAVSGSIAAYAVEKGSKKIGDTEPAGVADYVVVQDGTTTAVPNSFGRTGHGLSVASGFAVNETESVLFQYETYFSADGGPVKRIDPTNCAVASAIALDPTDPTHATSSVTCGACTFNFDHKVNGTLGTWTTSITSSGCAVGCLYGYTDYDVHSDTNNESSFQAGGGGFTGQFVDHHQTIMPDVHYLYIDQTGANHWQQGQWPTILNLISGFQACTDLGDTPATFMGDFTSAFQYTISPPGDAAVTFIHSRDDTSTIP